MDARLRPVLVSGFGFFVMLAVFGAFFQVTVPVPGTIYLLAPLLMVLAFYLSFEGMAKYVSGVVKCEGRRFSRRIEPIQTPLVDGPFRWLVLGVDGYQFIKYLLNQPNVDDGIGTVLVAPACLVESENERVIVVHGKPLLLSPFAIRVLMGRRRWRRAFERFEGFDPDVTRVYIVLWSRTVHPDALHVAESVGNVDALAADLAGADLTSQESKRRVQRDIIDKIVLYQKLTSQPEATRAARREPEEIEAR